ncbi:hypothetical protein [Mucilaginibacter sp. PAMB04168]|uniref:hypothetical protein n=1 Tax=Mucilaginibacter sp. PAMB04168 TaxID=3138567 RepID=UPI0031F624E0
MLFVGLHFVKNAGYTILAGLSILLGGLYLLHHASAARHDIVATGLLADMIITFPIAYYFLLIRPLRLRKRSLLLVFSCCCGAAYLLLPPHQRQYILQLRKLTFVLELGIIIYASTQISKIRRYYQALQTQMPDSAHHLRQSLIHVLGNSLPVKLLAAELTVVRFGLLCWKRPTNLPSNAQYFTTHRNSGYAALFGVFLFVGIIELVAVHLVVLQYSYKAAIVLSFISVYGIMFIISDFSAILKSPVIILDNQLLLRTGIRWRAQTEIQNIKAIRQVKEYEQSYSVCFKGGVIKSSANLLITFNQPVCIERLYHKSIMSHSIMMSIDQPAEFISQVHAAVGN